MSRTVIKPDKLAAALRSELTTYHESVIERVNAIGYEAANKLKRLTKATAPKQFGYFRKNIAIDEKTLTTGMKIFVWYVKPPSHRIVHLLVHGHANRHGGRTKGDPFLHNALNTVLPEYEKAVEEALQND